MFVHNRTALGWANFISKMVCFPVLAGTLIHTEIMILRSWGRAPHQDPLLLWGLSRPEDPQAFLASTRAENPGGPGWKGIS